MNGTAECENAKIWYELVNLYRPPYTKNARYTECAFLQVLRRHAMKCEGKCYEVNATK